MTRVGILLAVIFSLGPFLWIASTSLKSPQAITRSPPALLPDLDLTHYRSVLVEHRFLRTMGNSLVVAAATTLATVLLAALAAYPLARGPGLPGRRSLLAGVLILSVFPQVAVVGGIYRMLAAAGLLNSRTGLVLPYVALSLPFAIWLLTSFFREIPRELEEAARVDGCGPLATVLRVFLPLAAPAVFTTAILVFIFAWNEFFLALLINTDPAVQTLTVGIARFPARFEVPWGEYATAGVVATAPLVVLVVGLQRRIVRGLTAGAVKG